MDEFLQRALAGGLALSLVAGPVGVFMLWRRMAFFGTSLSHSAFLGIALGLLIGIDPLIATLPTALLSAWLLNFLLKRRDLSDDTLIGVIGHGGLALAMVLVAQLDRVRVDLLSYLFGDVLAITWAEVALTLGVAVATLLLLAVIWRPLLSATAEPRIAAAEGVPVQLMSLVYLTLLAIVIALGMRLVGALLITSLLIIPAAAARPFAHSPVAMAALATLLSGISVGAGILASYQFDWPAGPAIAVVAVIIFVLSLLLRR